MEALEFIERFGILFSFIFWVAFLGITDDMAFMAKLESKISYGIRWSIRNTTVVLLLLPLTVLFGCCFSSLSHLFIGTLIILGIAFGLFMVMDFFYINDTIRGLLLASVVIILGQWFFWGTIHTYSGAMLHQDKYSLVNGDKASIPLIGAYAYLNDTGDIFVRRNFLADEVHIPFYEPVKAIGLSFLGDRVGIRTHHSSYGNPSQGSGVKTFFNTKTGEKVNSSSENGYWHWGLRLIW